MNQEEGSSSNSSPMIFKIEQKQFESLSDLKSPQKELISPSIDSFSLDNGSNIIPESAYMNQKKKNNLLEIQEESPPSLESQKEEPLPPLKIDLFENPPAFDKQALLERLSPTNKKEIGKTPRSKSILSNSPLRFALKYERESISQLKLEYKDQELTEILKAEEENLYFASIIQSQRDSVKLPSSLLAPKINLQKVAFDEDLEPINQIYHKLFIVMRRLRIISYNFSMCNRYIDSKFKKTFSCFGGRFNLSKNFFIVLFFFSIILIGYHFGTEDIESRTNSNYISEMRRYIADNLMAGALIMTYYGAAFLEIRHLSILVGLFFGQFLPAFVLLIINVLEEERGEEGGSGRRENMVIEGFFAFLYVFWLAIYIVKEDAKRTYDEGRKIIITVIWYVFAGPIFFGVSVYQYTTARKIDYKWLHNYTATLAVPYVLFIILNWLYIHIRLINPYLTKKGRKNEGEEWEGGTIEGLANWKKKFKQKAYKLSDFIKLQVASEVASEKSGRSFRRAILFFETFLRRFSKFFLSVASFTILAFILTTVIHCLYFIIKETNLKTMSPSYPVNINALGLSCFFVLIFPIMFLIFITIITSNFDLGIKMLFFPFLTLILPVCTMLPVALKLSEVAPDLHSLVIALAFGPPLTSVFWMSMLYLSKFGRRLLFFAMTFFTVFFLFPTYYLIQMAKSGAFGGMDNVVEIVSLVLIAIGLLIILFYLTFVIMRKAGERMIFSREELALRPKFDLLALFRHNCLVFGSFASSLGFTATVSCLIYGFFFKPGETSDSEEGMIIGLIILVCILYIIISICIFLKIISPSRDFSSSSVDSLFQKGLIDDRKRQLRRQRILKIFSAILTFILSPIAIIPKLVLAKKDNDQYSFALLLTVQVGLVLIFLIFHFFFQLKQNFEEYSDTIVPGVSVFCWIFCFLPFLGIIPITVINLNKDDDIAELYQVTVGVTACLVFLGVGTLAIVANLFFNRIEYERKLKFIISKINKTLRKMHVKSDYEALRMVYEGYLGSGYDRSVNQLNDGKPVYYVKVARTDPDLRFSKIIVSYVTYAKLKKRQRERKEERRKEEEGGRRKEGIKSCLFFLCNLCFPAVQERKEEEVEGEKKEGGGRRVEEERKREEEEGFGRGRREGGGGKMEEIEEEEEKKEGEEREEEGWGGERRRGDDLKRREEEEEERLMGGFGEEIQQMNEEGVFVESPIQTNIKAEEEENAENKFDQIYKEELFKSKEDEDEIAEDFQNILFDAELLPSLSDHSSAQARFSLQQLPTQSLDSRLKSCLQYSDFANDLAEEKRQISFLDLVFRTFAKGDMQVVRQPWMDYVCFKELLRLSNVISCIEIEDEDIDLMFSNFCFISEILNNPIVKDNFKEIIVRVAMKVFPDETKHEALGKLLRFYFFPNLLLNLEEFQQELPREWEYAKYLMNQYGIKTFEDAESLQKKKDMLGLIKQMKGLNDKKEEGEVARKEEEKERRKEEREKEKAIKLEDVERKEEEKEKIVLNKDIVKKGEEEEEEKKWKEEERRKEREEEEKIRRKKEDNERLEKERQEAEKLRQEEEKVSIELKAIQERELLLKQRQPKKAPFNCYTSFINLLKVFFFIPQTPLQDFEEDEEEEGGGIIGGLAVGGGKKVEEEGNKEEGEGRKGKEEGGKKKDEVGRRRGRKEYDHEESPDWKEVAKNMIDVIPKAEKEYEEKKWKKDTAVWRWNPTNIAAIVSKIVEFYSMGSIALRPGIQWNLSQEGIIAANIYNNSINSDESSFEKFKIFFWGSFAISIIYWCLGYRVVHSIRKGQFGIAESKKGLTKEFFIIQFVNIASSSLYIPIMKSYIDTLACDYEIKPYVLYEDSSIECNTGDHIVYLVFAAIGMLLYYPLSSFLFPNIQFQNNNLDLKYNPTWIVVLTQVKLLVSATSSFFQYGYGLIINLAVSAIAIVILAFLNKFMQPCLIRKANILEAGGYLISAWMCFSGLINVYTSETYVCTLILVIGVSVIGISTLIAFFFNEYLTKKEKQRKKSLKKSILSPINLGWELGRMREEVEGKEGEGGENKREEQGEKEENGEDMFSFNKINQFEDYSVGNSPGQKNQENKGEFTGFKLIPLDQIQKTEIITEGDNKLDGEEEKIEEIQLTDEKKNNRDFSEIKFIDDEI